MASLHMRKLLKLGHSTVICLPPGWLAWKGLKTGDEVRIVTNSKLTIEAEPTLKGKNEAKDTSSASDERA